MKRQLNSIFVWLIFAALMVLATTSASGGTLVGDPVSDGPPVAALAIVEGPVPDDLIVSDGGLDWVWASPCNGGCSSPDPDNQEGWRFATDEELQLFPGCAAFGVAPTHLCAAEYFDPTFTHCDYNDCLAGFVASSPFQTALNGEIEGNAESFFVRGETAPAIPVPSMSHWAIILLAISIALLSVFRIRQKRHV